MRKRKKKRLKPFLFFIVIILLLLAIEPMQKITTKILYPLRYEEHITEYSNKYNLDKYLVMSVIKAESNFIPGAHSKVASGLMQITDDTSLWVAEKINLDIDTIDLEDPKTNINIGCYYLRYLLDYYNNNETLALAAYNAGMGNVDKWLKNPKYSQSGQSLDTIPFEETRKYITKINKAIIIYKKTY